MNNNLPPNGDNNNPNPAAKAWEDLKFKADSTYSEGYIGDSNDSDPKDNAPSNLEGSANPAEGDHSSTAESTVTSPAGEASDEDRDSVAGEAGDGGQESVDKDTKAEGDAEVKEKLHTQKELERLANITGRVPDDPEVIKLNLKLATDRYEAYRKMVKEMESANSTTNTHTMLQSGTLEDIATAKRDLEEAMYLYDSKFHDMDEDNARRNAKVDYRREQLQKKILETKDLSEREKLRQKYIDLEKARNEYTNPNYEKRRKAESEDLASKLTIISEEVENTEIFATYEMYKDANPPQDIKERRAGKDGAWRDDIHDIDWTLNPRVPSEVDPSDKDNPPTPPEDDTEDPKNPNRVNLGDTELKLAEEKIDESKKERLDKLEEDLEGLRPELAELYARNRRLIVGADNKARFAEVQSEYKKMVNEYLRLKAEMKFEDGRHEKLAQIGKMLEEESEKIHQDLLDFVGGDPENTDKTQEEVDEKREQLRGEAEKRIRAKYDELMKQLEGEVNAEFLGDYIEQESKLKDATIDKLDNGTICRKFVSKILTNKWFRRGLLAAGVVALAATGIGVVGGLAAGTMAIGYSLTAGGAALGALKGGLSGTIMSRQSSKTSAINGFGEEESVPEELKNFNILDKNSDATNVADWMMKEYDKSNISDRKSNRKRTLVSAGFGAAFGAIMSGVQINNVATSEASSYEQIDTTPDRYDVDMSKIDIEQGSGMSETFADLGGDPSNYAQAEQLAFQVDKAFGLSPGSNGVVPGYDGVVGDIAHTYPGTIDTWPAAAREYITGVVQQWAGAGLIPAVRIAGEPIFGMVNHAITHLTPNFLMNLFARTIVPVLVGGAVGSKVATSGAAEPVEQAPEPQGTPTGETPQEGSDNGESQENKFDGELLINSMIDSAEKSYATLSDAYLAILTGGESPLAKVTTSETGTRSVQFTEAGRKKYQDFILQHLAGGGNLDTAPTEFLSNLNS